MVSYPKLALPIFQLLLILNHVNPSKAASSSKTNIRYIRKSCNLTRYPKICYTSLSVYAENIKTDPKALAHTAINVTLAATQASSVIIGKCSRVGGLKPMETAAMRDCVELVSDALDELQKSLDELNRAVKGSRKSKFSFRMSNIQTWVSAALTDYTTCTDGLDENDLKGKAGTIVRREIMKVSQMTINTLSLINNYAST